MDKHRESVEKLMRDMPVGSRLIAPRGWLIDGWTVKTELANGEDLVEKVNDGA